MLRALILASAALCGGVVAQTATDVGADITFTLTSGETFTAQLLESNLYTVRVAHPLLGELTIARASIVEPVQLGGVSEAPANPAAAPAEEAAVVETATEKKPEGKQWSGAIDISANGTGGNSDTEAVRSAFSLRGEDKDTIDTLELVYKWGRAQPADSSVSQTNTNNKTARVRREWLLTETKWRPFAQATYEADAFTSYSSRTAVAVGAGYPVIDEENESLLFRAGLGAERKSGSTDNSWNAEAVVGGDYRLDIDSDSRFEATVEVYPNLEEQGYHGIANAHYVTALNPDGKGNPWNLKIGVDNKYDSDPGAGAVPWDYAWYLGLSYIF
ncbi:MAG: DUF481 domain-containing protein [Planctomycetes bacterium]|nr:DUF481 domain-containing protein [Planctomycetota bacterium]